MLLGKFHGLDDLQSTHIGSIGISQSHIGDIVWLVLLVHPDMDGIFFAAFKIFQHAFDHRAHFSRMAFKDFMA